ncbi:MAG TPA: formyl-CoA transferase, partial [Gammaproteobacteria bacterium]|nr:formyl-CoA transferase [Gammaproteobacteria bacterium]
NVEGLTSAQVKPAPELGEHNSEILRELGYDTASIAALRDGGVI